LREFSIAVGRSKNAGTCRSVAAIRRARSRARGDISATQSPPSEEKPFCGAK